MSNRNKKYILNESQESTSQHEAIKLVMDKLGYSKEEANYFVRNTLRSKIEKLKDKKLGKFTLGVTRMYINGELDDDTVKDELNLTLEALRSHLNEFDRNLNRLSARDLIDFFKEEINNNVAYEKEVISKLTFGKSDYKIVKIDSFEQAKEYCDYTNPNSYWCITYVRAYYNDYTNNGVNQLYFCLKNGFENIEPIAGENAPLDEYGLSMLSIIVDSKGLLKCCTTRWNHDNGGSDNVMNAIEISKLINVNFYETFKPNNKWITLINDVIEKLENGAEPQTVFTEVEGFENGISRVRLGKKQNWINTENEILFPNTWFDRIGLFRNGVAEVYIEDRGYNFATVNRTFLSSQWFYSVDGFEDGLCRVVRKNDEKVNYIKLDGSELSDMWFDNCDDFTEGFARVYNVNDGYNYIDTQGNLLSKKWYDFCNNFSEGFGAVCLYKNNNAKNSTIQNTFRNNPHYHNYINADSKLLLKKWADYCDYFYGGYGRIIYGSEIYYVDKDGNLYDKNQKPTFGLQNIKNNTLISLDAINENNLHNIIKENLDLLLLEVMTLSDVYQKYYQDIDNDTFIKITSLDPTGKQDKLGKYSKWLLNLYRKGNLNLNDSKRIRLMLETFTNFINKIDVKDINAFKSIDDLYNTVSKFITNPGQATSKSDEIRKLKKEGSNVVYEDEVWKVVVPKTQIAAQYYGKGTEWCTSSKEDGYDSFFTNYNKTGNLYININKKTKEKFQFHFEECEFMDENNYPITDHYSSPGDILPYKIGMTSGLLKFYDNKINNLLTELIFYGELKEIVDYDEYSYTYIYAIEYCEQIYFIFYSNDNHCYEFYDYINEDSDVCDIEDFGEGLYKLTFVNGNVGVFNFKNVEFYIDPDSSIEDIEGNYEELTILYKNGNKETITQDVTHPVYENKNNLIEKKLNKAMKKNVNKRLNNDLDNIIRESLTQKIKELIKQKQREKDRKKCKNAGECDGKDYM